MALPTGYTQVEWIKSPNGAAWAQIPWKWRATDKWSLSVSWDTDPSSGDVLRFFASTLTTSPSGTNPAANFYWQVPTMHYRNNSYGDKTKSSYTYDTHTTSGTVHRYYLDGSYIKAQTGSSTASSWFSISTPIASYSASTATYLMGPLGYLGSSATKHEYKCYDFQVNNSAGTEMYHFVPAVRNSDSKAGFYDTTNSQFYPSVTSTNFEAPASQQEPNLSVSGGNTWAGEPAVFTVTTNSDGLVTLYYNNQSIGTAYNGGTVSHQFPSAGNYTITATVAETTDYSEKTVSYTFGLTTIQPTLAVTSRNIGGTLADVSTISYSSTSDSVITGVLTQNGSTIDTWVSQSAGTATFSWHNSNLSTESAARIKASVAATGFYSAKEYYEDFYVFKVTPEFNCTYSGTAYGLPTVFTPTTNSTGLISLINRADDSVLGTCYSGGTISYTFPNIATYQLKLHIDATNYYSSNDKYIDLQIDKIDATLSYVYSGTLVYGNTLTLTPTTNSDGQITFKEGGTTIGTCYSGGTVSYTPLTAGSHTITAEIAATTTYTSASTSQTISIAKADTTLSATFDKDTYYVGDDINFAVTTDSDGVLTVKADGNTITPVNSVYTLSNATAGNHTFLIEQAEGTNYLSASTSYTINALKYEQTPSISITGTLYEGEDVYITVTTENTDSNAITILINGTSVATTSSGTAYHWIPSAGGTYTISANIIANSTYNSATTSTTATITGKIIPTTTINFTGDTLVGETQIIAVETNSDGNLSLYKDGSIFTDSAFTLDAGTHYFSAITSETVTYYSGYTTATREIEKKQNSVYLNTSGTYLENDPLTITASALSSTNISIKLDGTEIGTIEGSGNITYTPNWYGTRTLRAEAASNGEYYSGYTETDITITHVKVNPTFTYTRTGEHTVGKDDVITVNTNSTGEITFELDGEEIGSTYAGEPFTYHVVSAGTFTLTTTIAEDFDYLEYVDERQFICLKGTPQINVYTVMSAVTDEGSTFQFNTVSTNTDTTDLDWEYYRISGYNWLKIDSGSTTVGNYFTVTDSTAVMPFRRGIKVFQDETANWLAASASTEVQATGDMSDYIEYGKCYCYTDGWRYWTEVFLDFPEGYNCWPYTVSAYCRFYDGEYVPQTNWLSMGSITFSTNDHGEKVLYKVTDLTGKDIVYAEYKISLPGGCNYGSNDIYSGYMHVYQEVVNDLQILGDSAVTIFDSITLTGISTNNQNDIQWGWESYHTFPAPSGRTTDNGGSLTLTPTTANHIPYWTITVYQDEYWDDENWTVSFGMVNGDYVHKTIRVFKANPNMTLTLLSPLTKIHAGDTVKIGIHTDSPALPISAWTTSDTAAIVNPTSTIKTR